MTLPDMTAPEFWSLRFVDLVELVVLGAIVTGVWDAVLMPRYPPSQRRDAAMSTATLAAAIERDLLRTESARTNAPECFACGRSFLPRPRDGDDDTWRFCSPRCREAYDAGLPPYDPDQLRKLVSKFSPGGLHVVAGPPGLSSYDPLLGSQQLSRGIKRRGSAGWIVECLNCGAEFDSAGLRCCSVECERRYRDRSENEQLMAEAGMERPIKRKCEQCGGVIPNWRSGRQVKKTTRFCSPRCSKASKRASPRSDGPDPVLGAETAKIPA